MPDVAKNTPYGGLTIQGDKPDHRLLQSCALLALAAFLFYCGYLAGDYNATQRAENDRREAQIRRGLR